MRNTFRWLSFFILFLLFLPTPGSALERRRDQFSKDFSYFLYPIAGDIPGLGSAAGVGTSVLNIKETDADFTGYFIRGDFEATGAALLDLHLIPKRLILDLGYNDFLVAPIQYQRGINSSKDDYVQPKTEGAYFLVQLTLSFSDRLFEVYLRSLNGQQGVKEVLDRNGKVFERIDGERSQFHSNTVGFTFDLTDDRLDPRKGIRLEVARSMPHNNDPRLSRFDTMDYNLTAYLPARKWDTFAMNFFFSSAHITRQGPTDFATLQAQEGLNCGQSPVGPERTSCLDTEADFIDQLIARNRYGTASALGGTQRLRAYDNERFYAGKALFYGIEYRWNLTDERTPFDFIIAKGIHTGFQLAVFAEQGTVSDKTSQIFKNLQSTYGIGARLILSGVIIRADIAEGDEGSAFQLFITYPWSMFSVDSP